MPRLRRVGLRALVAFGESGGAQSAAGGRAEGFAPGSVVFLDVEHMRTVPDSMLAYHGAWTDEVLRDGSYLPSPPSLWRAGYNSGILVV